MSADLYPSEDPEDRRGPTRRAIDELVRRSGLRPVASIEDLGRFQADLWDSDAEMEAFLASVRASRAADA